MKLVTFSPIPDAAQAVPRRVGPAPEDCLGAVLEDRVLDLSRASGGRLPSTMKAFIEAGDAALAEARALLASPSASALSPLSSVRLKAPLPNPSSLKDFFAFETHARASYERAGQTMPEAWKDIPAYFKGNHREVYGPEEEIPWPSYTRRLDFECEVACVAGRHGRDLSPERAAGHVFGYMIFNDFSARDIQKKEKSLGMGPGKGKDFANAFGPWLVTADEADPKDFEMTVRLNGESLSKGHFRDQYWGFPLILSHISQEETIYPGDAFGSGTFYKGCGLDLDRWLKPGDLLELEVPVLGTLRNRIGAPKAQRELKYRKELPKSA